MIGVQVVSSRVGYGARGRVSGTGRGQKVRRTESTSAVSRGRVRGPTWRTGEWRTLRMENPGSGVGGESEEVGVEKKETRQERFPPSP